jgi:hypothetical protein
VGSVSAHPVPLNCRPAGHLSPSALEGQLCPSAALAR